MIFQKRDVKLMIVDDHAGVRSLIRQMVGSSAKEVRECASADEALRVVSEFKPDYVTMDVRMPGICAFDAVRTIRQVHPPATVVIVSSYNEPELKRRALDVGAIGYVLKENLFDLRDVLKQHAGQPELAAPASRSTTVELPRELMSPMAQLSARVEDLELFPALIGNELRMPLQAIQNFAALLQRQQSELSAGAETCLRRINEACDLMNQRIDALLTYGRSEHRLSRMEPVATDRLVRSCWEKLSRIESTASVNFRMVRLPDVRGDEKLLQIVFTNLLHNALKFSVCRKSPAIEINCSRLKTHAVFAVTDNGVGFDKKLAARLFVPLVRLHPVEQYPGAGLGLALARRIVHLHGGRIWAEAEPDLGATFYFTLPCDPLDGGNKNAAN